MAPVKQEWPDGYSGWFTTRNEVHVGKHLEHIFDKVGARSRTAALAKLRPSDLQLVG